MAMKCNVLPFNEQDKLEEGLLKTYSGDYVYIDKFGKKINKFLEAFADLGEQDKLKEGLIKFGDTGEYMHIDELGQIESYNCFVATAVYGDVNAPQVQTLRDFRDNVLMENFLGRKLVNFYYGGAGEKTADFIKNHLHSSVPLIRKGLDVLVQRYSKQRG